MGNLLEKAKLMGLSERLGLINSPTEEIRISLSFSYTRQRLCYSHRRRISFGFAIYLGASDDLVGYIPLIGGIVAFLSFSGY